MPPVPRHYQGSELTFSVCRVLRRVLLAQWIFKVLTILSAIYLRYTSWAWSKTRTIAGYATYASKTVLYPLMFNTF
ncbi:hypothetical protein GALMADRAFT_227470 [Galerina marginata CBS 339.88]|uniref:Uncharacterized protein n=1 Tax=Galerina marginata (strain CBS 339.88) TaxID=685588 RepID=A0A067T5Y9_GALM3|nr:hypothetical protein GALMADRAFT_227470 [Galerina marginata CBS 339.88]